jgi:hypothetical protein
MKKLMILTTALVIFGAAPVLADHHSEGGGKKGKMFKELDANEDGEISKAEFQVKHDERFKAMDVDGNGSISQEEAKAHKKERKDKAKERRDDRKERRESAGE